MRKHTLGENVLSIAIGAALSVVPSYCAIASQAPELLPQEPAVVDVDYRWSEIPIEREEVTVKTDVLIGSPPPVIVAQEEEKAIQIATERLLGDIELVAQLIEAEAGNQSYEGKIAVGCTVWNRVDSKKHPNNVWDVVFAPGAYASIENGKIGDAGWHVSEDSYRAAEESLTIRPDSEVLYFRAGHYHDFGMPLYQIGDHYFSK